MHRKGTKNRNSLEVFTGIEMSNSFFPKHDCGAKQSDVTCYNSSLNTHSTNLTVKLQSLENSKVESDLMASCPPSLKQPD